MMYYLILMAALMQLPDTEVNSSVSGMNVEVKQESGTVRPAPPAPTPVTPEPTPEVKPEPVVGPAKSEDDPLLTRISIGITACAAAGYAYRKYRGRNKKEEEIVASLKGKTDAK